MPRTAFRLREIGRTCCVRELEVKTELALGMCVGQQLSWGVCAIDVYRVMQCPPHLLSCTRRSPCPSGNGTRTRRWPWTRTCTSWVARAPVTCCASLLWRTSATHRWVDALCFVRGHMCVCVLVLVHFSGGLSVPSVGMLFCGQAECPKTVCRCTRAWNRLVRCRACGSVGSPHEQLACHAVQAVRVQAVR